MRQGHHIVGGSSPPSELDAAKCKLRKDEETGNSSADSTNAKEENKPIFLSIGYSSCHWCHVMAHECFENSEIAQLMNQWFISIKVDREEYPDVDAIYMKALVELTGQGAVSYTHLRAHETRGIA